MIDLSRHFQPLASIRSMIDSLACVLFYVPAKQVSSGHESKAKYNINTQRTDCCRYAKLNVLHMHISDKQSWPMEISILKKWTIKI